MSRAHEENDRSLKQAESGVSDVRPLPPLEHSFPASRKIEEGELCVPFRMISLAGDEPPLKVYDTSGPQGCDVRQGLPPRRAAWLARRLAEAGAPAPAQAAASGSPAPARAGVTQLHFARRGVITEEMRFVALRESV